RAHGIRLARDFARRSDRDEAPSAQDANALREARDQRDLVRREEHGDRTRRLLATDLREHEIARDEVEAERRIVEDEEVRRVPKRERELQQALLTLREPAERGTRRDAEAREAIAKARAIPSWRHPRQRRRELDGVEVPRRVGLLGHGTHALHERGALRPGVLPEETRRASIGTARAEHAAHERGLARSVASEQREA